MAAGAATGLGLGMMIGSNFLGANSAKKRRKALGQLADTPGLDTTALGDEAISGQLQNFNQSSGLVSKINRFNSDERRQFLESSLPGYQERKGKELGIIDSYLRGELPQDVQDQLWNSAAGRALAVGVGGSQFGRNLTARDFGLTSLGLMNQGIAATGRVNAETANLEMPEMANVARYLGVTPQELIGIRGNERAQRMNILGQQINAPSATDVWAKGLNDAGSALAGGGLGMMGAPGGGSGTRGRPTSGSYLDYLSTGP